MSARKLCHLGRGFGKRVHLTEWEIPKDKPELRTVVLLQLFDDVIRAPAKWTLIIPVLHQRDRGVIVPLNVVILRDWYFQRCHYFSSRVGDLQALAECRPHPDSPRPANSSSRIFFRRHR